MKIFSPPKTLPPPKAVKLREAAAIAGVCPNTIRRLIDRGRIRRVEGIRHVLIPISEIDKFLAE